VTFDHEHGRSAFTATVLSVTTRTVFLGDATTLYAEIPLASIVAVA